jgi:hypothetical protein
MLMKTTIFARICVLSPEQGTTSFRQQFAPSADGKKTVELNRLFKVIERMVNFDPHKRPTIGKVCNHPVCSGNQTRLFHF